MPESLKQRKIAVVGSRSVGKSSLTVQFVEQHFVESYYPTIENTFSKVILFKGEGYVTEIVDTAGQGADWVPLVIVGNKTDLRPDQRQILKDEGKALALQFKSAFIETSARTSENVSGAFELLIGEVEKSQNPSEPTGGGKCVVM
ncbi:GTP-binding protein [Agyrium rufum]|nr:GTP-binding protein [Agyrium rufum]